MVTVAPLLPPLEDNTLHRSFAEQVLREMGQRSSDPAKTVPTLSHGAASPLAEAMFIGSEWERPVRGGEMELLVQIAYWLAHTIDQLLGREPKSLVHHQVPQT